jgi:hypothetical protein
VNTGTAGVSPAMSAQREKVSHPLLSNVGAPSLIGVPSTLTPPVMRPFCLGLGSGLETDLLTCWSGWLVQLFEFVKNDREVSIVSRKLPKNSRKIPTEFFV